MKILDLSGSIVAGRVTGFKLPGVVAGQIASLHRNGYKFTEPFMRCLTASAKLQDLFLSGRIMNVASNIGFGFEVLERLNQNLEEHFYVVNRTFSTKREVILTLMEDAGYLFETEDYRGALETYDDILALDPKFLGALFERANIYMIGEAFDHAYADLSLAAQQLETFTKDPASFRMSARDDQGDFAEVEADVTTKRFFIYLKLDEAWNDIAYIWSKKAEQAQNAGDAVDASNCLRQVLTATQKSKDALSKLREVAKALGKDLTDIDQNIAMRDGDIVKVRQYLLTLS